MHYNFYFDETFHDKKITLDSDGTVNLFTKDKNDSYIGVFIGFENTKRKTIVKRMNQIEAEYIKKLDLKKEFKSTVFHRKNFKQGIRSFQRNTLDFYFDFFDFLENTSPIIHVNVLSKLEWLIRNVIRENKSIQNVIFNYNAFYYSLTKFVLTYHTPLLTKSLYDSIELNNPDYFKNELLNHLDKVKSAINGIERKSREIPMLNELYYLIDNYSFDYSLTKKYDFVYKQNFEGLINLLKELNISPNKVNLSIDKEEMTFKTAREYPFHQVKQVDSKNSIQIRIADQICGFIGRMMYALVNDNSFQEDMLSDINLIMFNDLTSKHLLSDEWFDIQPKHFELYKKIYQVLIVKQNSYWSTMTWCYGDQASMFYSLIRYISSYKDYDSFKMHSNHEHAEYYNTTCCNDLERHYKSFY